jgi:hypothetical protein
LTKAERQKVYVEAVRAVSRMKVGRAPLPSR